MRKIKLFFLSFILVFALFLLGNTNVKTNAASALTTSDKISVIGAAVRTTEPSGLKFAGSIDGYTAPEGRTIAKYGVAIAYGKQDVSDQFVIGGKVGNYSVVNGEVTTVNEKNLFFLSLIGIPTNQYNTYFTARAYVVLDDNSVVYGSTVTSRTLTQVTVSAKRDGAEGAFIDEVYSKAETTLNLNGGQIANTYSFKISKYNTETSGHYANISPKGSSSSNAYWSRIGINAVPHFPGLYKVVAINTYADIIAADYNICIHDTCYDNEAYKTLCKLIGDANAYDYFVKINGTIPTKAGNCDLTINFDKNPDNLLNDKYHFAPGERLPLLHKDYYTFEGWCGKKDLTDAPVKVQYSARNLYAKFTPTQYTINYELNGGTTTATLVKEYNYETETIVLPDATQMSKDKNTFGGWYDNNSFLGNAITEIPLNSYGDITLFAKWVPDKIIVAPEDEADKTAISRINATFGKNPTIIVDKSFSAGHVSTTFGNYECGTNAFPTIYAAIISAKAEDVIYVFDGTYTEALTVDKKVTLCGPNYGIKGTATRAAEAAIDAEINITAADVEFNGIKLSGTSTVVVKQNNFKFINNYSTSLGGKNYSSSNRIGIIQSDSVISNLTISDNYFYMSECIGGMTTFVTLHSKTSNLVINNNYMELNPNAKGIEAIMLYDNAGTLDINNNEIYYRTGNWLIQIGNGSITCTTMNVNNNILSGSKDHSKDTSGIAAMGLNGNTVFNMIHNKFYNITGTTFRFEKSTSTTKVNILYNLFDAKSTYNLPSNRKGSAVITYTDNLYQTAQTTTTSDYNKIKNLTELENAYTAYNK